MAVVAKIVASKALHITELFLRTFYTAFPAFICLTAYFSGALW